MLLWSSGDGVRRLDQSGCFHFKISSTIPQGLHLLYLILFEFEVVCWCSWPAHTLNASSSDVTSCDWGSVWMVMGSFKVREERPFMTDRVMRYGSGKWIEGVFVFVLDLALKKIKAISSLEIEKNSKDMKGYTSVSVNDVDKIYESRHVALPRIMPRIIPTNHTTTVQKLGRIIPWIIPPKHTPNHTSESYLPCNTLSVF